MRSRSVGKRYFGLEKWGGPEQGTSLEEDFDTQLSV